MKITKKLFCIVMAMVMLSSFAALTASADESDQVVYATVGDRIDWRNYIQVPPSDRYTIENPHVWDVDNGNCATMKGYYEIVCWAPGAAKFSVGFGDRRIGGGYVVTFDLYIKAKSGSTVIFKSKHDSERSILTAKSFGAGVSRISSTDCPYISPKSYKFMGWSNGNGTYSDNIPITPNAITVLTAVYEPYVITLNANGGVVQTDHVDGVVGKPIGELPTPTRANYIFDGWYTAYQGGEQWTAQTVFQYKFDCILYARWSSPTEIKTISVSGVGLPQLGAIITTAGVTVSEGLSVDEMYWCKKDAQTGSYIKTSDVVFMEGGEYSLYIALRAKSGYALASSVNAFVNGYPSELKHPTPVTYTLSCPFPALGKSVRVTFDPNGGLVGTCAKTVMSDGVYGALPIPVKSGYQFDGWYVSSAVNDKLVDENSPVEKDVDHKLTAHWKKLSNPDPLGTVINISTSDLTVIYRRTGKIDLTVETQGSAEYVVSYTDYDSSIIGIDVNGMVIPRKAGSTQVTVTVQDTAGNTLTDTCTVTVKILWWQYLIFIFLLGFLWY